MDLIRYQEQKRKALEAQPRYRNLCTKCIQPEFSCYCSKIKSFDSNINFVILIHPIEVHRRIATGRMSHLCLKNSHLIMGQNFTHNDEVNKLIDDPEYHSMILYPGEKSANLTSLSHDARSDLFPKNKKIRLFVIDGTWATAKKMMRQSQNFAPLQRICFSPSSPSNFRVRKQPEPGFYSTIEAIHHTIELIGSELGFDISTREHDNLIQVFDSMVERQLSFLGMTERKLRFPEKKKIKFKNPKKNQAIPANAVGP